MRGLFVLSALVACVLPGQARSAVDLTGEIEVAAFPPILANGQFISQTHIRLLPEGDGVVTAGMPGFLYDGAIHDPALPVAPGDNTFGNSITTPYAGPGLPAAGTAVYSVLLHFDPNLSSLPLSLTQGIARSATIAFDQPILGVYVTSEALIPTDPIFNPGGVTYSMDPARDLEFNYDGDAYSVSPDRHTLTLTMYGHNGGHYDETRIILAMPPTSLVPDVVGQTDAQATSSLQAKGLLAATTLQTSVTIPFGEVIGQAPVGGAMLATGATVELFVSAGVSVPDVAGASEAAAIATLEAAGFLVTTSLQASTSVAAGSVISQAPAGGGQASGGSTVALVVSSGAPPNLLEHGSIAVGGARVTIGLAHSHSSPVVVASVQYANNTTPMVARVSNVTPTSFDLRLQNPSGGTVATDRVHYLVVEAGVWNLDGFRFEAWTYPSTVTDGVSGGWVGQAQSYGQSYSNPVVLGQVMTENDPGWSVFWSQGTARTNPPSPTALVTGKMVGEDPDTTRAAETVGVIVFEAGHGMLAGSEFEAALGPDSVEGVDDAPPYAYPFDAPFAEAPQVAVVSMSGMDGNNGGWAQSHGATLATTTALFLSIDEDQVADAERSHVNEQVAYLAFSTPTAAPGFATQPEPSTVTTGGTLILTVAAFGQPAPAFQWQRRPSGTADFVDLAQTAAFVGVDTATLTVHDVGTEMDGDEFRCVATNSAGTATSDAVTLAVSTPVPGLPGYGLALLGSTLAALGTRSTRRQSSHRRR